MAGDANDDLVVAAAIAANAAMIVSGERHLLELENAELMPVLTVSETLEVVRTRQI